MKILLIDDDEGVQTLLRMTLGLEYPSAEVRACGDALSALDLCAQWSPDTIVMDSHLPGVTGHQFAGLLRERLPDARIISFTGKASDVPWADAQIIKASPDALQHLMAAVVHDPNR